MFQHNLLIHKCITSAVIRTDVSLATAHKLNIQPANTGIFVIFDSMHSLAHLREHQEYIRESWVPISHETDFIFWTEKPYRSNNIYFTTTKFIN